MTCEFFICYGNLLIERLVLIIRQYDLLLSRQKKKKSLVQSHLSAQKMFRKLINKYEYLHKSKGFSGLLFLTFQVHVNKMPSRYNISNDL